MDSQGRVEHAAEFWETLGPEERERTLSVVLEDLTRELDAAAAQEEARVASGSMSSSHDGDSQEDFEAGPSQLREELARGLDRLGRHGTWKAWVAWESLKPRDEAAAHSGVGAPGGKLEFHDGEEFRQFLQSCYPKKLHEMLADRDWNSKNEFQAETELRLRMQGLLQQVHRSNAQLGVQQHHGEGGAGGQGEEEAAAESGATAPPPPPHREPPLAPHEQNGSRRMKLSKRYASRNNHLSNIRSNQVELITMMLEALEQEHELLYHAFLFPVTEFVCERLDPANRESSREELFFEDLEKLPLEDVGKICEFLTEKIDGLSSRMKPGDGEEDGGHGKSATSADQEDDEGEGMGDVDLFQLENREGGATIVVNPKWLQHLEERCLSEDGHPMKVEKMEGQNGSQARGPGLVLDWVYGSIVSTAEKSRAAAAIQLGRQPAAIDKTYDQFLQGLTEQYQLEQKKRKAKWFLEEMVRSRKLNQELAEQLVELQSQGDADLEAGNGMTSAGGGDPMGTLVPDRVIREMLRREELLTGAKLFGLYHDQENSDKRLRNVKAQLRQTEPEFERLKGELEGLKQQPRGGAQQQAGGAESASYRSQAEMERHRAQLQDAAIEEQIEVQTAFREQGVQLKMLFGKRQQCEVEIAQRDTEIKQLSGWRRTIETMGEKFRKIVDGESLEAAKPAEASQGSEKQPNTSEEGEGGGEVVQKLRQHFNKEIRRQLYTEKEDLFFFKWINRVLKELDKRIDAGCAALSHMETILVNLACDDPGALVGQGLLLPRHQQTIDAGAEAFRQRRAKEAEDEILRLEAEDEIKLAQERERKQKKRSKQKEDRKIKREARREAEEKEKRERAEEAMRAAQAERLREEEARAQRERERAVRREMEEMAVRQRRRELLGEDDAAVGEGAASADEAVMGQTEDDGFTVVISGKRRGRKDKDKDAKPSGGGGNRDGKKSGKGRAGAKGGKRRETPAGGQQQAPPPPPMDSGEWPSPAPTNQQLPAAEADTEQSKAAEKEGRRAEASGAMAGEEPAAVQAPPVGPAAFPAPPVAMGGVPMGPMGAGVGMVPPPGALGMNGMPVFLQPPPPGTMGLPALAMAPPHLPMPPPYFPNPMPPNAMPVNFFVPPQQQQQKLSVLAEPFKPAPAVATEAAATDGGDGAIDKKGKEEPCPCGLQTGPCGL